MPQVSVVIPVYNIAAHLRQCMDSVLGQTLNDLEVICVDDGSTDGSPAILAEYAARDGRVRVLTQANAGPGAARNAGLEMVSGEYLIFLDSDDWFEPVFLEKMMQRARSCQADVTICRADEFDTLTNRLYPADWMLKTRYLPGQMFSPAEVAKHLFQFTYGWPWDKLYRVGFIHETKIRFPRLPNSEDVVFVFTSLALSHRLVLVDQVLVHHRTNRMESVSNSRHLNPDVPYQALCLLRGELRRWGVYPAYERSFLNWAMEFMVWNASNLENRSVQRHYLQKLKQCWISEIGFQDYPATYYEDGRTYRKYLLARYAPWPVFAVAVKGYRHFKDKRRR